MTDGILLSVALILTGGAATGFYLTQVRVRTWGRRRRQRLAWGAAAALAFALPLFGRVSGPVAGSFFELGALMLVCVALPYLDAWRTLARGQGR